MRHFFLLFLLGSFSCLAQQTPMLLAPGLISDGGVFGFTLSPDGQEAFWVQSKGKRDTLIILQSHLVNGHWQTPRPALFSGNPAWKDIDPIFSPDGHTVLFQSTRPVPGKPARTGFDIWAVKKKNDTWGTPYHLGDTINSDASESFASIARSGNIYFMKENENGTGRSDIYVSRLLNGRYQAPENIGLPVNTNERESNPYILPDEDCLLYFSSDPAGAGDVDLYITFRKNGQWTPPQNIGQPINTSMAEFCPFFHLQQKRLYFARQKKEGSRMMEDIYYYPFDLEAFRNR
jgi:hypothetical protein